MAFQPIFGRVPVQQGQSLLDMLTQRKMESEALASKAAQRSLIEAQTKKLTRGIEHPELDLTGMPEIVRQRAHVDAIKNAFGEDSPQAMQAQKDLTLTENLLRTKMDYQKQLAAAMPKRFLTAPSKAMMEREAIKGGFAPTGQPIGSDRLPPIKPKVSGTPLGAPVVENRLSSMSKDDLVKAQESPFGSEDSAALTLYLSKQAGLGDNTKKLTYGSLVETTLDLMSPYEYAMGYYSGVGGKAQYAKDVAAAQTTGKLSPQLRDYTKFVEMVTSTFIPQLTQYYGTSVTEQQQKLLREAGNPSTWGKSPEMALTAFHTLRNTLENETQLRRDLVTKPSFLTKKHAKSTPFYEKIVATGYSLNELVKIADKNGISPEVLINRLAEKSKGRK